MICYEKLNPPLFIEVPGEWAVIYMHIYICVCVVVVQQASIFIIRIIFVYAFGLNQSPRDTYHINIT